MQPEFESILNELGASIGVTLEVDAHGVCLLKLESECLLQLEWKSETMSLQLFAKLGQLPDHIPIRKALLLAALKANCPDIGQPMILSYSDVHRQLMLFQPISPVAIEALQLVDLIVQFEKQALVWIEALRAGRPPAKFQLGQQGPNIFQAMQWH